VFVVVDVNLLLCCIGLNINIDKLNRPIEFFKLFLQI